ncbi:uncharacterized protein PGTG_14148 [Puccinia graminis f. sp. tritici CRL 75-36-700-3]|uniref:HhH-GPD domain-containing protein n=1 Tax=Puccinia graminis f. sp. tritici (strain CRL 75-36-700-3 / race SCCL) TaxID=418459 RepID=E3KX39_PUCGT|nr:uncharacterized protein PGTG_14148 [Puccinia graminis f. sp. tritici CRL 75-36-700-3]EFP88809.1 hypothetical protein PGTG_14148 [Puccinia graminis f. sp. tritici CRL 75-36-700-3]
MTAVSRVTRSTTRKAIAEAQTKLSASSAKLTSKQTAGPLEDEERRPRKKRSKARVGASSQDDGQSLKTASQDPTRPFVLSEAQAHLAALDDRFSLLFGRLPCGPFDNLSKSSIDQVAEPFRNLCCSILGQQVSCLAARSITYKFIKLFQPELPPKLEPNTRPSEFQFPSPSDVLHTPVLTLRTAGLSQRKAEYIHDLAQRFVDRRLDPQALLTMEPRMVVNELCKVRGIGRWTAEMFLIFCVKHPDILPHADLAIQKGILRWYTTALLPLKAEEGRGSKKEAEEGNAGLSTPPIPVGCPLSRQELSRRLTKPLKPGLFLTPLEMEQLTEQWKPYRSLPVCYMWSLTGFIPEC